MNSRMFEYGLIDLFAFNIFICKQPFFRYNKLKKDKPFQKWHHLYANQLQQSMICIKNDCEMIIFKTFTNSEVNTVASCCLLTSHQNRWKTNGSGETHFVIFSININQLSASSHLYCLLIHNF